MPILICISYLVLPWRLRQAACISWDQPFRGQGDTDCLLLIRNGGTKVVECLPSGFKGLSSLGSTEKRRQNPKPRPSQLGGAVKLQKSNDYGFVLICSSGVNEVGGSGSALKAMLRMCPHRQSAGQEAKPKPMSSEPSLFPLPVARTKGTAFCFHRKTTNYQEKREWGPEVYETQLWCQKQRA